MLAALAGVAACAPAAAQTPAVELDAVLVTATRTTQRLADSLAPATVITRAQIDNAQETSLVELLGRQAGVEFARAGGPGSQAGLFVRGSNSSQVLVLLDGVRLNMALSGAAVLGGVGVDAIERIEIVRGNLSSVYGSEAIGGVVQIFTRGAERPAVDVHGEIGSGETRAGGVHLARRFDGGALSLTVAARTSAPFSAIDTARVIPGPFAPGANPDIDGNRNRSGALRARGAVGGVDLEASVWDNRNDTDFDSTADGPDATHVEHSRQQAMHVSAGIAPAEGWRSRWTVAQSSDDTTNRVSEASSFNNGRFEGRNRSASWNNEVKIAQRAAATFAYEFLEQRGASTSYDPTFSGSLTRYSRRVHSAQAGLVSDGPRHQWQVSLRHDEYSDVGAATTGLVAYGYALSARWRVSAQVANAFRAPSFNDLYFPFFGNPELSPERARSAELALRYAAEVTLLRLSVFRNRISDLIVYDAASSQARNIARADIDGIELSASTRLAGWRLQADCSVTRARDDATGERLLRRAPYVLHLAASRSAGRWDGSFEITRSGARDDADINTFARTRLPGYTLARLAMAWRQSDAVQLLLRVENLFDADYALVDGYNTPRRGVFAGVKVHL